MASILSAGTTNSTALNLTADTSGSLILASNNNVTAVTIATNQSVTFANNATFPTTIGVGGATPSSNGSGITFPATQSASSNANTLDDYEEGTWTPTATAQTGAITTYSSTGAYIKVGKNLFLSGSIVVTTVGTAGGALFITGLPFTPDNVNNNYGIGSETQATGTYYFTYIQGSSQIVYVTAAGGAITWASGRTYQFSMTYQTSS